MGIEELLDMPSFGIIECQGVHFIPIGCGKKGPETVRIRSLSASLDELENRPGVAASHFIRKFCGGEACPAAGELFGRNGTQLLSQRANVFHGHQEVEGRVELNVVEQLSRKMFHVGQHREFRRAEEQVSRPPVSTIRWRPWWQSAPRWRS